MNLKKSRERLWERLELRGKGKNAIVITSKNKI